MQLVAQGAIKYGDANSDRKKAQHSTGQRKAGIQRHGHRLPRDDTHEEIARIGRKDV